MWDNQWAFQINSDFSYTGKTLTQHTNDCWSALLYKHPQTWMSQTAFYESASLFPPDEYLRAAFISLQHVESSRVANQQNPIVWHRAELLCSFQNFSGMRIFHSCPFLKSEVGVILKLWNCNTGAHYGQYDTSLKTFLWYNNRHHDLQLG